VSATEKVSGKCTAWYSLPNGFATFGPSIGRGSSQGKMRQGKGQARERQATGSPPPQAVRTDALVLFLNTAEVLQNNR
jgi:hypothetical protein